MGNETSRYLRMRWVNVTNHIKHMAMHKPTPSQYVNHTQNTTPLVATRLTVQLQGNAKLIRYQLFFRNVQKRADAPTTVCILMTPVYCTRVMQNITPNRNSLPQLATISTDLPAVAMPFILRGGWLLQKRNTVNSEQQFLRSIITGYYCNTCPVRSSNVQPSSVLFGAPG